MTSFTVFLCEPQPIVVEGLRKVLSECDDLELIGHSDELHDALALIGKYHPAIVLLGQSGASKGVLAFLNQVRETSPSSKVVLWVSELTEMDSFRALQAGARGILKKTLSIDLLLECLRAAGNGNIWIEKSLASGVLSGPVRGAYRITPREREIVELICRGMKNKEIAKALSITPGTVKVHLMHIFEKTGVKDRFQLALQARQLLGMDDVPPSGS